MIEISAKQNNQEMFEMNSDGKGLIMYKSNREIIAENMPDDSTVLTLKKDLQTRSGIIMKGTQVILRQEGKFCDGYKVILSDNCCCIYLSDVIKNDKKIVLPEDVPKYPERIQKFVNEYFITDSDKTKEYRSYLEKRHINAPFVLFMFFWVAGLIAVSVIGWIAGEWCNSSIFNLPPENVMTGILNNLLFASSWSVLGCVGIRVLAMSNMQFAIREHEKTIRKLLVKTQNQKGVL